MRINIDGADVEVPENISILEALSYAKSRVPHLCHDPRLSPQGACRLCDVEVKGIHHAVAACKTQVAYGMVVKTRTPELENFRRMTLKMLARNYPADAVIKFPNKEFHQLLTEYGVEACGSADNAGNMDVSHPYIAVDMSRCVSCFRCVRAVNELQLCEVWQPRGRGESSGIVAERDLAFGATSCVSCGACVDVCPTGALEDKTHLHAGSAEREIRTTCVYCGVGCEMKVGVKGEKIVAVSAVVDSPVNKGHLCIKGHYAFNYHDADDRVIKPAVRVKDASWQNVAWHKAVEEVATRFTKIIREHGADAIGVLGSARATNEDNYLAQKFARVVLGTNNLDCCARVCHTPTAAAMKTMLGTGAATNSFDDIEQANLIMVCGANATENHPVVGQRILQRVKQGVPLIVIDPRRIELARHATLHLQVKPGTNVALFNALTAAIVEENLVDASFLAERVSETDKFSRFILDYAPEKMASICGVDAPLIRQAARLYAKTVPAMCLHGLGMTEHLQGTEGVMTLVNLALLTGNIGKTGSGVNPLRGQNNVQGAAHMGCDRGILTGGVSFKDGKERFEKIWGAKLPDKKGMHLMEMLVAAETGKLKALWVIGYDILTSLPHRERIEKALAKLDLLIVQDLFMNETCRFAHVFLPAASNFEKEGTFMNAERRIQRIRRIFKPRGEALPDWQIITRVAERMGCGEHFAFHSPHEIWDEIRKVWPGAGGITYERLEEHGLQWPCPDTQHPGTTVLHENSFSGNARAALQRIPYLPTPEKTDSNFPLLLVTGRTLAQFNAGTMTMRTDNAKIRPTDTLDISAATSQNLGLGDGEQVKVVSRYGTAILPVRVSDVVPDGQAFATFHDPETMVNRITSDIQDRVTGAPEYKVTAIRIEKAAS